jgi:hypothetical protein
VTPVPGPAIISTMAPAPVIPRAGSDEHAACEPLWTIKAIRCACVRVIGVVPVRTHRRRISIARPRVRVALVIALIAIGLIGIALVGVALIVSGRNSGFNLCLRVTYRQH